MVAKTPSPLFLGRSRSGVPDYTVNFSAAGKQIALVKDTNYEIDLALRFIEMLTPLGFFLMKKKGDNTIITFIIGMVCVISYSTVAFGMSIPYVFFRHYLMQNDPLWVMIFIFAELSTIVYYIYAIQEKSIRTKLEFLCLTLSFIFSILWLFVDSMSKNPAYSDIFMVQLFGILWCSISIFGVGKALLRTYDRFINYGEMNDNK